MGGGGESRNMESMQLALTAVFLWRILQGWVRAGLPDPVHAPAGSATAGRNKLHFYAR